MTISLQVCVHIKIIPPENFAFLIPRILTNKVCEMFVYKQIETIEIVKK